jgi:hypothetical protein
MNDNRFERAYREYKQEKEQLSRYNRFECLRGAPLQPPPIRESAGRFDCLVDDNYPRHSSTPVRDTVVYLPRPEPPRQEPPRPAQSQPDYLPKPDPPKESVTYLPRPAPSTKVESTPTVKPEPWRRGQAKKDTEPVKDINYHFPALGCTRGELPKTEIKLPESRAPLEMIVKPIVVPNNKKVLTMMFFKDGKVVSKEVYEDGTELPDNNLPVIIKKPKYTSWASVLKKEDGEVVYYDAEPQK